MGKTNYENTPYIVFFGFLAAMLYFLFSYIYTRRYNKIQPRTSNPQKFKFLEELKKKEEIWEIEVKRVKFQVSHRHSISKILRRFVPFPQKGLHFIQEILNNRYGFEMGKNPKVQVPEDVVTVSIPCQNFKCGRECTEFSPRDGTSGTFMYQMLSGGVQVTWFYVDQKEYLAGVCLYMDNRFNCWKFDELQIKWALSNDRPSYTPDPKRFQLKKMEKVWCKLRNQWIIITRNHFGEIEKYVFNGRENRMDSVECFDCHLTIEEDVTESLSFVTDDRKENCLDWLRVEYCENSQRPVMVGKDLNGEIVHYDWNQKIGKFQWIQCYKCAETAKCLFDGTGEAGDEPPSYGQLEMIETLVDTRVPPDVLLYLDKPTENS